MPQGSRLVSRITQWYFPSVRCRSYLMLFGFLLSFAAITAAQIIEIRRDGDEEYTCTRSGLFSDLKDCSVRANWYTYVSVGFISSVTAVQEHEFEVQITPQEVFHGKPSNPLTVRTEQGRCLPKIAAGDRWLFFLRKEEGKPLVLGYGGDSRPVADAQQEIDTLRRLQTIGDYSILRGSVVNGRYVLESNPVPSAWVVARSSTDKSQFVAMTDANGHYEFPPLAPGKYDLTVEPIGTVQADPSWVELTPGSCWDLALTRAPHGLIKGRVQRSDGSPVAHLQVALIDSEGFNTATTDEQGYFQFDSLRPGEYRVGINRPGAPEWKIGSCGGAGCQPQPASLYYSGTRNPSDANVIFLHTDEKRDDINFVVTPQ